MEQETLEEASIRLVPNRTLKTPFGSPYEITPTRERNTFKKGAKWQAERMYSEEEVYNLLCSIHIPQCDAHMAHDVYVVARRDLQFDAAIPLIASHDAFGHYFINSV